MELPLYRMFVCCCSFDVVSARCRLFEIVMWYRREIMKPDIMWTWHEVLEPGIRCSECGRVGDGMVEGLVWYVTNDLSRLVPQEVGAECGMSSVAVFD